MSVLAHRRGFLRGLVSLPLIGGGVTLIGNPTAAAVPTSRELLASYDAWLAIEREDLLREVYGPEHYRSQRQFIPWNNAGTRFYDDRIAPASSRAAVVMSTVGCDLRRLG